MSATTKKFSNLPQRIATGLLGASGIIFGIVYSEWTYLLVFFIICILSLREFYKLSGLDGMIPQKTFGTICGLTIFFLSFFIERGSISYRYYFVFFPLLSCVYMIKLYKKFERKPFTNIAYTFLGIFYIAVPLALLNIAAFEEGTYHFEIIFGCLFILWATDTGAYFAGSLFGKRKLFERISPKKSWEGVIGGALLALAMTYGISFFFDLLAFWKWLSICVIIVIGGVYGDLIESLLKRSIEIKDSGNSLPGHGGFLDRFDGLFISAPFIVAFLEIF
ncbi:MAG: phosphatidate cytidylyltransferase [Cytophagales bacterium]|nr:phosphatidate cytidylyltransferase [Cytophagales bacterium]MCA6389079.1 phosphatidate cytidylyltransferase [Cytophagales bacterium]MCA6393538.1 phosphatidate cytidylyltransferase [Cytophagales bacterium]MCA6396129.1 phosphatidate cytidylyltransferase [Cytophagales bacterium]MCA6399628.1 phosphatidate cytidylyltransferase [Cytophagales bacterium]